MTELTDIASENQRQWKSINALTAEVKTLSGTVEAQNKINADLVALLRKALSYEFYIILILIAALVYGAIGKEGLFAVRQSLPLPQRPDDGDTTTMAQPLAPPPDNRLHAATTPTHT